MRITMLGTSRSGKTAYTATLLHLLYKKEIRGFSLVAKNKKSKEKIEEYLKTYNTLYRRNKFSFEKTTPFFPPGTEKTTTFDLFLKKDNSEILDLQYIDYKGGALKQVAGASHEDEVDVLRTVILGSDIIILFFDSEILYKTKDDEKASEYLEIKNITRILLDTASIAKQHRKKVNVNLILTKIDSIPETDIGEVKKRAKRLIYQSGNQLDFNITNICEISVIGKNKIRKKTDSSIEFIDYNLEHKNIIVSFAQAILVSIDNQTYLCDSLSDVIHQRISRYGEYGKFGKFLSVLTEFGRFLFSIFGRNSTKNLRSQLENSQTQLIKLKQYEKDLIYMINEGI